jgi:hypothetical protein
MNACLARFTRAARAWSIERWEAAGTAEEGAADTEAPGVKETPLDAEEVLRDSVTGDVLEVGFGTALITARPDPNITTTIATAARPSSHRRAMAVDTLLLKRIYEKRA